MKKQILDSKQAAEYLGYKNPQTLANLRAKRVGPNYIKMGRTVRYSTQDLDNYLDSKKVELDA